MNLTNYNLLSQTNITDLYSSQLSGQSRSSKNTKLEKAAHEFEASMMQELLKPMKEKDPLFSSKSNEDGDDSSGVLAGYSTEVLANALSQNGGLGIAKEVIAAVERDQRNAPDPIGSSQFSAGRSQTTSFSK